jgi:hypothetical protein
MSDTSKRRGSTNGRRAFLGTLAASAAATAAAIGTGAGLAIPDAFAGPLAGPSPDAEHWLDGLKGKHKQITDGFAPNDGFPMAFVATFLGTQGPNPDAGAVLVLRHWAFPFALTNAVWAKYKIGSTLNIADPETKAPAVKNPFLKPKSGVLLTDEMAVDKLLAKGVIIGCCNVALTVLSGKLAGNAGVTPAVALKEWTAAVIPGITIIPSGVWGVNRAQEKGCSYCSGG